MSAAKSIPGAKKRGFVITVDGPSAAGKGTLARRLASHFGFDFLDTGSLYRGVGLVCPAPRP